MPGYIFLDNWVLSDYTKDNKRHLLSEFIRKNNYSILVDSLSFTELYNPQWQNSKENDRTARVAEFLGQHSCVIVNPQNVWQSEFEAFPGRVKHLPVQLNLDDIPIPHRTPALLMFLRRDEIFLQQGKDIAQWATGYESVKASWPNDVNQIIEHACNTGVLTRNQNGKFTKLKYCKEKFLRTLDGRHLEQHFSSTERQSLQITMKDVEDGVTSELPSVRSSSLYFWYAYIEVDKAYPMKRKGSDIGDYYQMSLIPYCAAFTVDTTMYRLARRVLAATNYKCEILNKELLDVQLESTCN